MASENDDQLGDICAKARWMLAKNFLMACWRLQEASAATKVQTPCPSLSHICHASHAIRPLVENAASVAGFPDSAFKGFDSRQEAELAFAKGVGEYE